MTPDEIMTKASFIYDHVGDINTMAEAQAAVRDAASMLFYLAKHVKRLSELTNGEKGEIENG